MSNSIHTMRKKPELILEVGAAGGSISLWSINTKDGKRSFIVTTDESTLQEFMDEEDAKGISFKSKSARLDTFDDALVALGKYPWYRLHPLFVHNDFEKLVLSAVMKLGGEKEVSRWQLILLSIKKYKSKHV